MSCLILLCPFFLNAHGSAEQCFRSLLRAVWCTVVAHKFSTSYSRCPGDGNMQLGMSVLFMFPARFSVGTGVDEVALILLHNFFLP